MIYFIKNYAELHYFLKVPLFNKTILVLSADVMLKCYKIDLKTISIDCLANSILAPNNYEQIFMKGNMFYVNKI